MNKNFLKYKEDLERQIHQAWFPHQGQLDIVSAFLVHWCIGVFLQCGRKIGKTELAIYLLYIYGKLFEGSECYYIADEKDHARDILWDNGRLPRFFSSIRRNKGESLDAFKRRRDVGMSLQDKWVKKTNNQDMSVRLDNDSIIKVDGAKNFSKADGLSPTFVVYDEFKSHDPRYDQAMRPNLNTFDGRILIMGTPPDNTDNYYCKTAREFRNKKGYVFFRRPSWMNPHVYSGPEDPKLIAEKEEYIRRGEYHVFAREYEARIIPDQNRMIFPMLTEKKHRGNYEEMVQTIKRRIRDWEFYVHFDPASSSVFGVLFIAINKYDKRVWLLDEIYEGNQMETTSKKIWVRARDLWRGIHEYDDDWYKGYDYREAWFATEIAVEFNEGVTPCEKDVGGENREAKLSVIKDCMLYDRFKVSDKCVWTWKELANYKKDENGKIPKTNDHNIDNLRYTLNAAGYNSVPKEPINPDALDNRRFYKPEDDLRNLERDELLLGGFDGDYFDSGF